MFKNLPCVVACAFLVAMVGLPQAASADVIQIQLGGVDLFYTGGIVRDSGTSNPDPLTNATFLVNSAVAGVDDTDVTLDLSIPGVLNLPAAGGSVNSAIGGDLDLALGGGEHLSLTLQSATVTNVPLTATLNIIFIASATTLDSQQLPFGITIAEPVSISFSTQTTEPISQSGGHVTVFRSAGTGEISGVPEPATMSLLVIGSLTVLRRRRRQ